ncbi:MAG: helix-hairpin-helix domain-containing protein [Planctomycetales bacterium]
MSDPAPKSHAEPPRPETPGDSACGFAAAERVDVGKAGDSPALAAVETAAAPIASNPPDARDAPRFGLRRNDQLVVGAALAIGLALMAVHWARLSGWGMRPIEIDRQPPLEFQYRLEINTADRLDWAQLPGIGETLAERIVADRETNGHFATIDDLRRVKGIGPKTIDRLRPWLRAGDTAP